MCQLIARKLERIALNDGADVGVEVEEKKGEGKGEGKKYLFFEFIYLEIV